MDDRLPMIPCLVVTTSGEADAVALAHVWRDELRGPFDVRLVKPPEGEATLAIAVAQEAIEAWLAEASTTPKQKAVLVIIGPFGALDWVAGEVNGLRSALVRVLFEHVPDGWGGWLTDEGKLRVHTQISEFNKHIQWDAGETGRRYKLTVDGATGYLFVTTSQFKASGNFEPLREHWVWPAGKAWTAPFTLLRLADETYDGNDLPEKHPHGALIELDQVTPARQPGETRFVFVDGADRVFIFKKLGAQPRYFASPNLVDNGWLKPAEMTFKVDDGVTAPKGKWWTFP